MELKVVFRNSENQKLIGLLNLPEGKGPFYGVIICSGFTANKNLFFYPDLSERLVSEGFAALRFDYRSLGESEGDFHPTYKTMVDDVNAAIEFMISRDDVDEVALAGHSMGGTSVIMAGSHEKVTSIITYGAVAYPEKSVQSKRKDVVKEGNAYTFRNKLGTFKLSEAFFDDAKETKPLEAVAALHKPLMIVHGTEDSMVDLNQANMLFVHASMPKKLKRIGGSDHWFEGFEADLADATVDFLAQN